MRLNRSMNARSARGRFLASSTRAQSGDGGLSCRGFWLTGARASRASVLIDPANTFTRPALFEAQARLSPVTGFHRRPEMPLTNLAITRAPVTRGALHDLPDA